MDGTNPALNDLLAHTRWVEELARRLVRDPAAASDVAQSAWAIALREPDRTRGDARGWLGAVVRNLARERHRRDAQRGAVERAGARGESLPSAHELVARAESERALVRSVTELDEPHRTILLLHYFEGLPVAEIARREGATTAAVAHRLTRAHARLRERLAKRADGAGWLAALAPILRAGAPNTIAVADGALRTGWITMTTTTKIAVPALLVAALCAFLLLRGSEPSAGEPEVARADPAIEAPASPAVVTAAPADSKRRSPAESAAEMPVKTAAAVEPPAVAPAPVAAAPDGRIRGLVLRPDASPAAERKVRLLNMKPPEGQGFKEIYTSCDANGRFDKGELAPGMWAVSTWPDKAELELLGIAAEGALGGMAYLIERTVELRAGGVVDVEIGVPPKNPIHVTGRVLRDGEPVRAVAIQWLPAGADVYDLKRIARTLDDGRYDVTLDRPGRYFVTGIAGEARPDWAVVVADARELAIDFELAPNAVEGRVVDEDGKPVAKATVELSVRAGRRAPLVISSMSLSTPSDAEGRFRFACLPEGTYAVHAFGGAGEAYHAATASKDVRAAPPGAGEALELTLAAGTRVPARVVDAAGKPKSGTVFVFDAAGDALNAATGYTYFEKEKSARYTVALAPGRYSAVAASGDAWSQPVPFELVRGEAPAEIVLRLEPAAIVDIDAAAFPDAFVDARDEDGRRYGALYDKARSNRAVERDWDSDAPTFRLPPGRYVFEARGRDGVVASARSSIVAGGNPRVVLKP